MDMTQGNAKHVILGQFEAKATLGTVLTSPARVRVPAAELGGDCTIVNTMISNNSGNLKLRIVNFVNTLTITSAKDLTYMSEFNNFCPSATGLADDPDYVCLGANDWDIVTDIDHPRNMGFNRLLNKYMNIMNGNPSVLSQGPFWQMEDGKPPRLINFD